MSGNSASNSSKLISRPARLMTSRANSSAVSFPALELPAQRQRSPFVHPGLEIGGRHPHPQPEPAEHPGVVEETHDIAEIEHEHGDFHATGRSDTWMNRSRRENVALRWDWPAGNRAPHGLFEPSSASRSVANSLQTAGSILGTTSLTAPSNIRRFTPRR